MKLKRYNTPKEIEKEYSRTRECNYKKCKAACCRYFHLGINFNSQIELFAKGFGFEVVKKDGDRHLILRKDCKYLDRKTLKCKIQNSKSIPCIQFPVPDDNHYKLIYKVCSYKFPIKKRKLEMSITK